MFLPNPIAVLVTRRISVRFLGLLSHGRSYSNKATSPIPPANIKWYYSTDIPLTKPHWYDYKKTEDASKFVPFSDYDSHRIESTLKKFNDDRNSTCTVSVSEDKLFEVDVKEFTLSPIYWEGPVYEVRRGLWFNVGDGIPMSSELTKQIERGYREKKPYLSDKETRPDISKSELNKFFRGEYDTDSKQWVAFSKNVNPPDVMKLEDGNAVLYFNNDRGLYFPQTMLNSYQLGILRGWGVEMPIRNVIRLQRGYSSDLTGSVFSKLPDNPIPGLADILSEEVTSIFSKDEPVKKSVNYSDENDGNDDKQSKQMKQVIEDDFENSTTKQTSNREIDHLVFCIHGIGQVLGNKYESINFPHEVNVLRNTMKAVYRENKSFKSMVYDEDNEQSKFNNRIQVLPISWRHRVDFQPSKPLPSTERLPSLEQLNVDGVKSIRNMIGDVALDILLYYEVKYFNQILAAVTSELNKVYEIYMERNPNFKGKIHVLGHSLGSAIAFDIASVQPQKRPNSPDSSKDLVFDIDSLFCVGSPVGVFKLLSEKNIVSRKDVSEDFDPRDPDLEYVSPRCENLYNLYHPCDPIGYRMEPLIKPRFARFKAEEVPFAVEGISSQIKGITSFTDELSDKISRSTSWLLKTRRKTKVTEGINDRHMNENALGDIVRNLVKSDDETDEEFSKGKLSKSDFDVLRRYNRHVRVDYSLPMGVFDISLVSAISAHITYFEDQDTAGFIMSKLLSHSKVESKTVLYDQHAKEKE